MAAMETISILAEEEYFEFLGVIFFIILSIVGALLKKNKEKQEQTKAEQRRREWEEARKKMQVQPGAARKPVSPPPRPVHRPPHPAKTGNLLDQLRKAVEPQLVELEAVKETVALPSQVKPSPVLRRAPVPVPAPRPHSPAQSETRGLVADIDNPLPQPVASPMTLQQERRMHVDLTDPVAARNAILLHEILSPPKALREPDTLWDI